MIKAVLREGRENFKNVFLEIFRFSELRIFWFSLLHLITAEEKKGILKEVMVYFE